MRRFILSAVLAVLSASRAFSQDAPAADHHQHLFSPALVQVVTTTEPVSQFPTIAAKDLIGYLDAAGIKRAVVLSTAYIFSQPSRKVENEYERVKADNDWTSAQVALYPDRLVGFCGLNPLKDYALTELARCAKDPRMRRGVKLHFGNSVVDYHNAQHIAQLQRVFRAANSYGMAIVVHMRASISLKMAYGRDEAQIFLNELVPAAPDVPIQIAHLAGAGGYDPLIDQALSVFVDAIAKRDPRTRNLWFDVTTVAIPGASTEEKQRIATRIRELGVQRVLYGSDAASGAPPREGWAAFKTIPLTAAEFQIVTSNLAPYLR